MKAKQFIDALDHAQIAAAIHEAEKTTSGQIRVFISHRTDVVDVVARAGERFLKLGMEKTSERNGVLIYFAPEARKFALVGDRAIHEKVGGDEFWQGIVGAVMRPLLKQEKYTEAIVAAVREVGIHLAAHFPVGIAGHVEELPDDIEEEPPQAS
jgi:uncharacterized membrane protein